MSSNKENQGDTKDMNGLQRQIDRLLKENSRLKQNIEQVHKDQIEYLQNVSHQLVAPLNAIKWHIENLTEARVSIERAKIVLRSIYSQATLSVHLAKNFALMSNLEADHALTALKEPLQWVNPCKSIVNLVNDFQPLAWDKSIDINIDRRSLESVPDILVMKPLISQVFSNIIENAIKYSDNDTGINISGSYDNNSDSVSVEVMNLGISLTDEEISSVFDRGFRSKDAKNKYPAGTGFGLYIARRIVEIHKGNISAKMDKGRVVFRVTLSVRELEGKARQREKKYRTTY